MPSMILPLLASWTAFGAVPDPKPESPLRDLARSQSLCRRVRRLGVRDLKRRSAPALLKLLENPRMPIAVRREAARVLGRWDGALVAPALTRLLREPESAAFAQAELKQLSSSAKGAPAAA